MFPCALSMHCVVIAWTLFVCWCTSIRGWSSIDILRTRSWLSQESALDGSSKQDRRRVPTCSVHFSLSSAIPLRNGSTWQQLHANDLTSPWVPYQTKGATPSTLKMPAGSQVNVKQIPQKTSKKNIFCRSFRRFAVGFRHFLLATHLSF